VTTTDSPLSEVEAALETEPHQIVALERNRGWLALQYHINERRSARERTLMHAILKTDAAVDQRRVDYLRGYFDALEWMSGLPVRMRSKLKEGGESAV
jgi:hypothetical protein